jgi:hypothetical protein
MRVFVGFDDTDNIDADRGTGKLARWFEQELPEGCRIWGVVRQQLLVHEDIPYTSHNSSACAVVEVEDDSLVGNLVTKAANHIQRYALDRSDPGLCVAAEGDAGILPLVAFGRKCTRQVVTQKEAMEASSRVHLSGHGGTNQGIIGAAAAVGLTADGWNGRFIELRKLRSLPDRVRVFELENLDILTVSLDRDSRVPAPEDLVLTNGWLRPRLWGNRAVLAVIPAGNGTWESLGGKRQKNHMA